MGNSDKDSRLKTRTCDASQRGSVVVFAGTQDIDGVGNSPRMLSIYATNLRNIEYSVRIDSLLARIS
jgi:hypothetical protein